MAGRIEGKVAFITGAARGQGRAHAIRLAQEGADIIAVDCCASIASVPYPLATEQDLQETVSAVAALGRRIVARKADVRDLNALQAAVQEGVEQFGRLDIVSANAGIFSIGAAVDLSESAWQDMIDVNLTGAWRTVKAAVPHIVAGGRGGSIILTSSVNGTVGAPMYAHYIAAKHGVVGLVRALAIELTPNLIRVNGVMPGGVATDMLREFEGLLTMDVKHAPSTPEQRAAEHPLKNFLLQASDISGTVLFLASDDAKYITGALVPIEGMGLAQVERGLL